MRETLQGIRYKFNAPITRSSVTQYGWQYVSWTKCSAICAGGKKTWRGRRVEWCGKGMESRLHFTSLPQPPKLGLADWWGEAEETQKDKSAELTPAPARLPCGSFRLGSFFSYLYTHKLQSGNLKSAIVENEQVGPGAGLNARLTPKLTGSPGPVAVLQPCLPHRVLVRIR